MLFNIEIKAKARDIPTKKKAKIYFAVLLYMTVFTLTSILYFCVTYSLRNELAMLENQLFELYKNSEQNKELINQIISQVNVVNLKILPYNLINGINLIPILIFTLPLIRYIYYSMKKIDKTFLECMVEDTFSSSVKKMLSDISLMAIMLLKIFLWSLLFVIPGIYKSICYSQAIFIKIENPQMSANECIKESQHLIYGHKSRFFMLWLSFIGWQMLIGLVISVVGLFYNINIFLGMILCEIVALALQPIITAYMIKSSVIFYCDLKGEFGQPHAFNNMNNIDPFDDNYNSSKKDIDPFSGDIFDSSSNSIDPFSESMNNPNVVDVKDVKEIIEDDKDKKDNKNKNSQDDIDPFN